MDQTPLPAKAQRLSTVLWCDTARPIRFFMLDGRAAACLLLFLVHMTWWTAAIAAAAMLFFGLVHYIHWPLPMIGRRLRRCLAGRVRPARHTRRLYL